MRFEAGTHNYPGIASLYAGIRFITSTGLDAIEKKNMDLTRLFIRELKNRYRVSPSTTKILISLLYHSISLESTTMRQDSSLPGRTT